MKLKKKSKKKIKVFSTFTGAGGFEIALDDDRFATIGYCEIDSYCKSVLRYYLPGVMNYGSVSELQYESLPDFDLLVGGSPCQDLSVAGARKGLSGKRSGLFYDYVKILRAKKPKYFIWENVKGTYTSQRGWDLARVQIELADAGYDFRWELLNACDFGVPQNRERIFIVGHLRGESGGEILLKGRGGGEDYEREKPSSENGDNENKKVGRDISYCLDSNYAKGTNTVEKSRRQLVFYGGVGNKWNKNSDKNQSRDFKQGNRVYHESGISPALSSQTGQQAKGSVLVAYSKSTRKNHIDHRARINDNANTLNTGDGCRSQSTANFVASFNRNDGIKQQIRKAHSLNSSDYRGINRNQDQNAVVDKSGTETKIRRLTPIECERLMSWPDNHTQWGINEDGQVFEVSDTQRYKMCGNGVVSEVVRPIADLIWKDFNAQATAGSITQ